MSSVVVVVAKDNPLSPKDIEVLRAINNSPSNFITLLYVLPKLPAEMFQDPNMKNIEAAVYLEADKEIQEIQDQLRRPVAHIEKIEGKPGANGWVERQHPDVILTHDPNKFRDFVAKFRHQMVGDKIPTMDPVSFEKSLETQQSSSYSKIAEKSGGISPEPRQTSAPRQTQEEKKEHKKAVGVKPRRTEATDEQELGEDHKPKGPTRK